MDPRLPSAAQRRASERRAGLLGSMAAAALLCLAALPAQASGLLWHVSTRLAHSAPVSIIAFGSSSTSGVGASSVEASYPACLERDLRSHLHFHDPVTVANRGVAGDDIDAMMRRLDHDVLQPHPDLVIWQLGTNDALEHMPLAHFETAARHGIKLLRKAGIDLVLMEPQHAPRPDRAPDAVAYRAAVRRLGAEFGVPVIRRFDLMARWAKSGETPALVAPDGLHMSDTGYEKLGEAVASLILSAAHPTTMAGR
jgi:acyl-CoA thioesterase I